jgi:hypothetical protein
MVFAHIFNDYMVPGQVIRLFFRVYVDHQCAINKTQFIALLGAEQSLHISKKNNRNNLPPQPAGARFSRIFVMITWVLVNSGD